ncbi:MAG: hypothetical protein H7256_12850 [Bdellovibrio sp.]|nr:hypothetical protein [Bdellovibrio sp.]
MSKAKKNNNPADDLMESLLKDIQGGDDNKNPQQLLGLNDFPMEEVDDGPNGFLVSSHDEIRDEESAVSGYDSTKVGYESTKAGYNETGVAYESTRVAVDDEFGSLDIKFDSPDQEEAAMNPSAASLFDPPPKEVKEPIAYKPKKTIEELLATANRVPDEEPLLSLHDDPPRKHVVDSNEFRSNDFKSLDERPLFDSEPPPTTNLSLNSDSERTLAIASSHVERKPKRAPKAVENPADDLNNFLQSKNEQNFQAGGDDRTIAVTGFQNLKIENHDDKVKVSIGQNRSSAYSTGYQSWGGGAEASLGQAENLRIAQEKILQLERENEKLRSQNDELISASDIIKERSDLLTAQITEFKNDKEGLEESFKNEVALLKGHLHRKETEFQKAQIKVDDLESRLKFDMKKIRVRERELENRLELIRAEKNAVTKSKDEQILDLRRKMDVLQMEVDSYRQKCVDLNKLLENNQDSFKRTTRALRLAMANLELQEENKVSVNVALKKVD